MEQDNLPVLSAAPSEPINAHGGVWPPPPTIDADELQFYPFKYLYLRDSQNIADFREGAIGLAPQGVAIRGKSMPRAEIYIPVMLVSFIFLRWFCFIPYLIMRYGTLKFQECYVPWDNVRRVVLVPNKSRACIVYDAPNLGGTEKTFCLAFSLDPAAYSSFVASIDAYAPGRAYPGRLRPGMSRIVLGLLIILGSLVLFGVVIGVMNK